MIADVEGMRVVWSLSDPSWDCPKKSIQTVTRRRAAKFSLQENRMEIIAIIKFWLPLELLKFALASSVIVILRYWKIENLLPV